MRSDLRSDLHDSFHFVEAALFASSLFFSVFHRLACLLCKPPTEVLSLLFYCMRRGDIVLLTDS